MRRSLIALAALVVTASVLVASGETAEAKSRTFVFTVSLVQEQTVRHPHAPAGDAGDTFSTTLRLFTITKTIGYPPKTLLGTMSFTWGPLKIGKYGLSCSADAAGCTGTTNLSTVTRLPGGTLTAGGKNLSLAHGEIAPVVNGTGAFKGATGKITFLSTEKEGVFSLKLPA